MAEVAAPSDPYDAVIADLTAKRDHLDAMISALVSFRTVGSASPAALPTQSAPPDPLEVANTAGMFLGMSIVDASKKLLGLRKRAMTNAEILAELQAGGIVLTGTDPLNVVGSVLTRRFGQFGDVVRVGRGTWGLKEWYPNRTFKPSGLKVNILGTQNSEPSFVVQMNDLGGEEAEA